MRELKKHEIAQINGAGTSSDDITMGIAGAWASTVTGGCIGLTIGGPAGRNWLVTQ